MKKAVIYARYSCDRQTEQSIEGQLRACSDFAEKNNLVIVDTYVDRAMTGTNDKRDAFQAMLMDSEKHVPWDIVIVYALDRFGRNAIEVAVNKQKLKKNGKTLISATQRTSENIDGTKNLDGILLENVYIGLAEYYSAELSQKVRRGLNESRQKQQFTGGYYIYGYNIENKKYVINSNEAEVVRQVYSDYINGKTVKNIVADLTSQGIKNKRGKPWALNTVYRMLRLEKYVGIVRYGDELYKDTVPPIVDSETFTKVQAIIQDNKRAPSRRKSYGKYLLSGKLYCGECGSLMTGESGTSKTGNIHYYYKCFGKKRHNGCTFPSIQKDELEDKIFEVCCRVLKSGFIPTIVDAAYNIQLENAAANITIINLQGQLESKEKALNNIMRAIEEGVFTSSTKNRLQQLEEDIDLIKGKIETETVKQQSIPSKQDYYDFVEQFIEKQEKNEDFKEALFGLFMRQIVLFRDKIRITFNFTPDGGKRGKNWDIDTDVVELQEAQEEYKGEVESSNLLSVSPPKRPD